MRRQPPRDGAEDCFIGHFGARLKLLQVASERAQQLESARPGRRGLALPLIAPGSVGHQLHGQRPLPAQAVDVAGEALQSQVLLS